MQKRTPWAAVIAVAVAMCTPAIAQFGQNKVGYGTFDWHVYHSPHFDVHHYMPEGAQLEQVIAEAESAYLDLSKRLDHEVRARIPLIVYRTHNDFEQTNVDLGTIPEGVGAFAEPFMNRMVVPIDEPPDKRYKLLRHELVHIFQFDIFFAGSFRRALQSQAPTWLMEGMASYLADDEDSFDQMVIRDAVVNNRIPSLRELDVLAFITYRYGNAIFDFIETTYGAQGLRNFIFEFKKVLLTPNIEKALEDAFGLDVDQFDRRFARFLRQRYLPVLTTKRAPEDYGKEAGLSKADRFTFSPALSPSGELIAALATPKVFELDVVILSAKDGKVIRNLTKGFTNRYDEVSTGAFDGRRDLSWSPDGDRLAFFVTKENYMQLLVHDVLSGRRTDTITIRELSDCSSPAFAPDGRSIAFSGNKDGYWDIWRYDLEAETLENLTQDEYYDTNPSWSADGKTLLYNRRIGAFEKIFTVTVGAPERKSQLTGGASSDIQPIFSRDAKWIYFASDRGTYGVFNLHRMDLATGAIQRLTDLTTAAFTPAEMAPTEDGSAQLAYAAYYGGTFRVFRLRVGGEEVERAIRVGQEEPQSSPLAPSRRAAYRAEKKERSAADLPTAIQGTTRGVPDAPGLRPEGVPAPEPPTAGGVVPVPQQPVPPPAEKPPEVVPTEPDTPDADLVPFRAPLQLGFDPTRNEKYKTKWSIERPDLSVGVADDGTFITNAAIQFSDLLGDQRVYANAFSVSSYSNIDVIYMNLKRRLDWGARLFDFRDYYVYNTGGFAGTRRIEQAQRLTSLSLFASYPFNRFYRVEGEIGYAQRRFNYPFLDPQTGFLAFREFSDNYPLASVALVGDTTRYQEFGPFQGYRFRLEVGRQQYSGNGDSLSQGTDDAVNSIALDYRAYQHVTRRSLLALRLNVVHQTGDRGNILSLGGINQLRGYEYREFFGTSIAHANLEFRFPLIDFMVWSFGMPMGPFRGFLFADIGTAWFDDAPHLDCFDLESCTAEGVGIATTGRAAYDPRLGVLRSYKGRSNGIFQDIHASAGFGFHVPILGLPATWSFSKRYDGDKFGPMQTDFYIIFDW